MLRIILSFIMLLAAIPAFWLVFRYNLHMFQLNGYKNDEQLVWIRKNGYRQNILKAAVILGAAAFTACPVKLLYYPLAFLYIISLLLCLMYYGYLRKHNTKKKLKFTPRATRLAVTGVLSGIIIACVILFVLSLLPFPGEFFSAIDTADILEKTSLAVPAASALALGMAVYIPILACMINSPVEGGINRYYVNDAKKIISLMKGDGKGDGLTVIGITGSYGKTSFKYFLNTILSGYFNVLMTPESYNTPMGVVITVRGSLKPIHEIFICEMGARHVGNIKEICDIVHPDHGVITSVGPQHLETFLTLENIQSTKFELADALPEGGMLFLNGDSDPCRKKGMEYLSMNPVFYTTSDSEVTEASGYRASDIALSSTGTSFTVTAPDGETARFSMQLIGAHNVQNVLGAVAVAHRLGVSLQKLPVQVRKLTSVSHRMQLIRKSDDLTIIDDAFNSNPSGSKAAVETLKLFDGNRILITPGMVELGDREEYYNHEFGRYAASCCDHILLVGGARGKIIMEGALEEGFPEAHIHIYDRLEEALKFAYSISGGKHKYVLLENDLPDNY